jgi:hypothetical protein
MSASVIILMVITMIFLFVAMVLAAMASSEAQKKNLVDAHKYSLWSAVVCGISIFIFIVILVIYIYSSRIASAIHTGLGSAQSQVGKFI